MGISRSGHAWRTLQARVFRTETHCGLCGGYVDQTLPTWPKPHPMSRTVDHIISVRDRPDLYLARTNCQLAYRKCNGEKWAGPARTDRTPTVVDW